MDCDIQWLRKPQAVVVFIQNRTVVRDFGAARVESESMKRVGPLEKANEKPAVQWAGQRVLRAAVRAGSVDGLQIENQVRRIELGLRLNTDGIFWNFPRIDARSRVPAQKHVLFPRRIRMAILPTFDDSDQIFIRENRTK